MIVAESVSGALLQLSAPELGDAQALLEFEVANRAFFEATINARPAAYYSPEGVLAAIRSAIDDANADRAYQYLLRDAMGRLVGRINLTRVRRAHFHSAELGYRVGEADCGKGYGREAVRQMLRKAYGELGLLRIEAAARAENAGSVRILQGAGFRQFGCSTRSFQLGGVWYDTLHFEHHA